MYLPIAEFTQLLDTVNALRFNRALAVMPFSDQHVYQILPVLFHYHHSDLPGYLDPDIPQGICLFEPNERQQHFLNELNLKALFDTTSSARQPAAITGMYSMGSTSSMGQNINSDLDIWICYQPFLKAKQISQLQAKCQLVEIWAASFSVKVNFFLISEHRFRQNHFGCLGNEDCGSTQHILLLDEFYRSMVRLAGKRLLWYIVPIQVKHDNYDNYVQCLFDRGQVSHQEWLDLGNLSPLSAAEYFGASLWQLYKSIDSPYKAVLKTLLLEAYSWEYPETQLLATEIKQYVHDNKIFDFELDAYLMMLERVTRYLTATNDMLRLDLVRRCFYLKIGDHLSKPSPDITWRYQILTQLASKWGWDQRRINLLDNRANWKIERVKEAHDELLAAMMQSYRNLIRFARKNNLTASVSPQDIGVLTRKLYAAFEALPGKVTLVNPLISPDLSETHLTFIHISDKKTNPSGWYLYNQQPKFNAIISHQPLEYHPYLSKLIAWCYFNGLLTHRTQLHVKSDDRDTLNRVISLAHDLARHFPIKVAPATPKALYSPCEIRELAIIINLERDPTRDLNSMSHIELAQLDVLNFGPQQQSLVTGLDLVYRNSWNEIRTLSFSGKSAILDMLQTILAKMHQDAQPPKFVGIFCYGCHFNQLISNRIHQLVTKSIELRLSSTSQNQSRFKAVRIAGQIWGLFFERLTVSVKKLENAIVFYQAISNNKLKGISVNLDINPVELPNILDGVASEGIIQFFFEDIGHQFNIYMLDESNKAEVYFHCEGCKIDLIREISHFYSSSHDRHIYDANHTNFNLPQFYQIVSLQNCKQVIPFSHNALSVF